MSPRARLTPVLEWELDNMQYMRHWLQSQNFSLCTMDHNGEAHAGSPVIHQSASTYSILHDPPTDSLSKAWYQSPSSINRPPIAYKFFHEFGTGSVHSVIRNSSWEDFRELGFGFWDTRRTVEMELATNPGEYPDEEGKLWRTGEGKEARSKMWAADVAFTWKSIEGQAKAFSSSCVSCGSRRKRHSGLLYKSPESLPLSFGMMYI